MPLCLKRQCGRTLRRRRCSQAAGGHAIDAKVRSTVLARIILPRIHGRIGTARSKKIVRLPAEASESPKRTPKAARGPRHPALGLHPTATSQYRSTAAHQVSYHFQSLFSKVAIRFIPVSAEHPDVKVRAPADRVLHPRGLPPSETREHV